MLRKCYSIYTKMIYIKTKFLLVSQNEFYIFTL